MNIEIKILPEAAGRIDASLGQWTVSRAAVLVNGREVARIEAENVAEAGFDIRPVLGTSHPAGRRAAKACGLSFADGFRQSLQKIAGWLAAHPEAMAMDVPRRARWSWAVSAGGYSFGRDYSLPNCPRVWRRVHGKIHGPSGRLP